MMNWEQKLERLAARARFEAAPDVDVAGRVIGILMAEAGQPVAPVDRLWLWLAAVSSAVAAPAAAVALIMYNASTGPLPEIMDSISWAM